MPLAFFLRPRWRHPKIRWPQPTHDITPKKVQTQKCPDFFNRSWESLCFFRGIEQWTAVKLNRMENYDQW